MTAVSDERLAELSIELDLHGFHDGMDGESMDELSSICDELLRLRSSRAQSEQWEIDARRYRHVYKHGFPNRHRNDDGEVYWTYYDGTSWGSCNAAIDSAMATPSAGGG